MGDAFSEFMRLAEERKIPLPYSRRRVRTMPTYDYQCECGHSFEKVKPMRRCQEPEACPECGSQAEKIILEAPAMHNVQTKRSPLGYRGDKDFLDRDGKPKLKKRSSILKGTRMKSGQMHTQATDDPY